MKSLSIAAALAVLATSAVAKEAESMNYDPYAAPTTAGYGYQQPTAGYGYQQPTTAGYGYQQPTTAGYGYQPTTASKYTYTKPSPKPVIPGPPLSPFTNCASYVSQGLWGPSISPIAIEPTRDGPGTATCKAPKGWINRLRIFADKGCSTISLNSANTFEINFSNTGSCKPSFVKVNLPCDAPAKQKKSYYSEGEPEYETYDHPETPDEKPAYQAPFDDYSEYDYDHGVDSKEYKGNDAYLEEYNAYEYATYGKTYGNPGNQLYCYLNKIAIHSISEHAFNFPSQNFSRSGYNHHPAELQFYFTCPPKGAGGYGGAGSYDPNAAGSKNLIVSQFLDTALFNHTANFKHPYGSEEKKPYYDESGKDADDTYYDEDDDDSYDDSYEEDSYDDSYDAPTKKRKYVRKLESLVEKIKKGANLDYGYQAPTPAAYGYGSAPTPAPYGYGAAPTPASYGYGAAPTPGYGYGYKAPTPAPSPSYGSVYPDPNPYDGYESGNNYFEGMVDGEYEAWEKTLTSSQRSVLVSSTLLAIFNSFISQCIQVTIEGVGYDKVNSAAYVCKSATLNIEYNLRVLLDASHGAWYYEGSDTDTPCGKAAAPATRIIFGSKTYVNVNIIQAAQALHQLAAAYSFQPTASVTYELLNNRDIQPFFGTVYGWCAYNDDLASYSYSDYNLYGPDAYPNGTDICIPSARKDPCKIPPTKKPKYYRPTTASYYKPTTPSYGYGK